MYLKKILIRYLDCYYIWMLTEIYKDLNFVISHSGIIRPAPFRNFHSVQFTSFSMSAFFNFRKSALKWSLKSNDKNNKHTFSNKIQKFIFSLKGLFAFKGHRREEKAFRSFVSKIRFHLIIILFLRFNSKLWRKSRFRDKNLPLGTKIQIWDKKKQILGQKSIFECKIQILR